MRAATAFVLVICFTFIFQRSFAQSSPNSVLSASAPAELEALSFTQWKERQIAQALGAVEAAKLDLTMGKSKKAVMKAKAESTGALTRKTGGAESAESRLSKALLNLDVAKGLDLNDYVMLYLSEQSDSEKVAQAVRQLNAVEISKLVQLYKQNSEKSSSALKDPVALEATR